MLDLKFGDLAISSPAFRAGQAIPQRHSNAGGDHSPELRWTGVPDGTRQLVLIVHDPDAPLLDGFTHWVVGGLDPSTTGLAEDASEGFVTGANTLGDAKYMGPAPPPGHGTHYYFFFLYALDAPVEVTPSTTRDDLLRLIDGHIIQIARTVGTYETT